MAQASLITLLLIPVVIFYCSCTIEFCTAIDTITSTQPINDNDHYDSEPIVSDGATFKLGFFSPVNSTNRYVAIWYNHTSTKAVVWLANRDKPLNDSSGIVTISENGNLVVLNGQKQIVWSSGVPNASVNSSAQLLDSGNLILRDGSNGNIIWQSFEHPSDSFLQGMKLRTNKFTDKKTQLTSWKSPSDPSSGRFTLGINPLNIPEIYVWIGSHPYWRSGPWNRQIFIGIDEMISTVSRTSLEVVEDKEGNVTLSYTYPTKESLLYFGFRSDRFVMEKDKSGGNLWSAPDTECEVYGKCGPFASCNVQHSPICTCLQGFDPKDMVEWSGGNWSSGCARTRQLQCERNNSGGEKGKDDEFLRLKKVKVPAFAELLVTLEDSCKSQCLNNCSCLACAYYSGIGCMQWSGDLIDIQEFSYGGADLYIRVAYSELEKKRSTKVVITISVLVGSVTIAICIYLFWWWMARRRGRNQRMHGDNLNQIRFEELPVFSFEERAIATNNFDMANKLGQGGFGPVYKGKLPSGQDIAVKRFSRSSRQGLVEFMNEVVVISQLQHRNLVRRLGCCVEGEEKMLSMNSCQIKTWMHFSLIQSRKTS